MDVNIEATKKLIKTKMVRKNNELTKKLRKRKMLRTKNKLTEGNGDKSGICEECGKFFKYVREHALTHVPKQTKKQYPCKHKECERTFTNVRTRNAHYKRKHLNIRQHCDVCNKDVTSLPQHTMRVHEPSRMPYACVLCARRFISPSALAEHVSIHTSDRKHACERCGQTFRLAVTMRNHIRSVHQNEKSHLCQYCPKRFFKKIHLQYHLRSHTNEKPHECKECGKRFAHPKTLKLHVQTHSTTKDYHCTECSMSFVRADYLRNHMISHTKIKKHQCKYCGVSFGRSDHRKRHEFTAHEKYMLDETNDGKNKMAAGGIGGKNMTDDGQTCNEIKLHASAQATAEVLPSH